MSRTGSTGDVSALPRNPPRQNSGRYCTLEPAGPDDLPEHITPCVCPNHDGVCSECNFKITVGPSGVEYGHARATNRGPQEDQERRDCPHRPSAVESRRPQGGDGR